MGGLGQQTKQEKLWTQKEETKSKRKILKRKNIKKQQAFVHSEGQQCKSGAFHENSSSSYYIIVLLIIFFRCIMKTQCTFIEWSANILILGIVVYNVVGS